MTGTLGAIDFVHALTVRARFFMMRWRLALTPPLDGIDNMAIDAALLEQARAAAEGVGEIPKAATLAGALGYAPTAADIAAARFRVVRHAWDADGTSLAPHLWPQDHIDAARALFAHFRSTWRR